MILNESEVKMIKEEATKALKTTEVDIRALVQIDGDYGYGDPEYEWTDWETYQCTQDKVDIIEMNMYPFGEVAEGDAVFIFPRDTELANIEDVEEFEIDTGDRIYISKTGLQKRGFINGSYLYYALLAG